MRTPAPSSIRHSLRMAVADLDDDGVDEILLAAAVTPVDAEPPPSGGPGHGGHMRAYLHVLKYEGGTNPRLVRHSTLPIANPHAHYNVPMRQAKALASKLRDHPSDDRLVGAH